MSSSGDSGPRWARDIITVSFWSASAVNVFIYTYRAAIEMWKRPPLTAWTGSQQQGLPQLKKNLNEAFNQPKTGKQNPEGKPGKKEEFLEEAVKAAPNTPILGVQPKAVLEKVLELFK